MTRDNAAALRTWTYGVISGALVALVWMLAAWYFALPLLLLFAWFIPTAQDLEQPSEERQSRADDRDGSREHVG